MCPPPTAFHLSCTTFSLAATCLMLFFKCSLLFYPYFLLNIYFVLFNLFVWFFGLFRYLKLCVLRCCSIYRRNAWHVSGISTMPTLQNPHCRHNGITFTHRSNFVVLFDMSRLSTRTQSHGFMYLYRSVLISPFAALFSPFFLFLWLVFLHTHTHTVKKVFS